MFREQLLSLARRLAPSQPEVQAALQRLEAASQTVTADRARDRHAVHDARHKLVRALVRPAATELREIAREVREQDPERIVDQDLALAGWILAALRDVTLAMAMLGEAVDRLRASDDLGLRLITWGEYAVMCAHFGDLTRAVGGWQEMTNLARLLGDRRLEGMAIANLGYLYGEHDEPVPYEANTRRALEIFREIESPQYIAHALCNLGGALTRMGRVSEAKAAYEEGLPIAMGLDWPLGHALYLGGMGGVLVAEGKLDAGLDEYRKSLTILERIGDVFHHARHRLLMARCMVERGRPSSALPVLQDVLETCAERGFQSVAWQAQELLATALEATGDFEGALRALREHIALRAAFAEARLDERVRAAEQKLAMEHARREASIERARASALEAVNAQLEQALATQRSLQTKLEELARTDGLTGLYNRRHLDEALAAERLRLQRRWRPLALAILDLDHFKNVNDAHGHDVGDEVIQTVAQRLRASVRAMDVVGRWGGEEFCVILPETDGATAMGVMHRVAAAIAENDISTRAGPLRVTVSIGCAEALRDEVDMAMLFRRADAALLDAKGGGRAQVRFQAPVGDV